MARIDKATVVLEVARTARRVHVVAEDPAVVKAAKQAGQDFTHALRSTRLLGEEVHAAWSRSA